MRCAHRLSRSHRTSTQRGVRWVPTRHRSRAAQRSAACPDDEKRVGDDDGPPTRRPSRAHTHAHAVLSIYLSRPIPPRSRSRGACFFQRVAVWTVVEVEHTLRAPYTRACATSSTANATRLSLSLFCGCVVVWVVLNKHRCCLLGVRRCSTPTLERVHVRTTEENVRIYADENLVTALVPSETACLASSPGSTRRMAVWTSRDESVFFLL